VTTAPTSEANDDGAARALYLQVLGAIALGIFIGHFFPSLGERCQPLGELFVRLVKLVVTPVIFTTVVLGLAGSGHPGRAGKTLAIAIAYFEVMTTAALAIGLIVIRLLAPGANVHADPAKLDASALPTGASDAGKHGAKWVEVLIPENAVNAFARGDLLQVLVVALLVGLAISRLGAAKAAVVGFFERASAVLFSLVSLVMRLAPIGAFGAMAFTIGRYRIGALASLGALMLAFYVTCAAFVLVVLGAVMRACGGSIVRLLIYLRSELLLVLGTSSSESGLPRLMLRLEELGCERGVVGLVVPTGYSFNLDGTSIYLTMASVFIAQALGIHLTLRDTLELLALLLITSKGAAGVTGSGFVTLAATLGATGKIPVAGITLILGVDRFMSEARALTNFVGNAVATIAVAKLTGALDATKLRGPRAPTAE
jgi:aerobic C4-dicarboxylate transport protein